MSQRDNAGLPGSGTAGLIATRLLHSGRVITVNEDEVRYPDGTTGHLTVVRHPGASAIVPFLSDPLGEAPMVLLIRQYRHAAGGYLLEIPAGRLDAGESPEACAVRELAEETGCTAGKWKRLTTIHTTPGFSDERIHLFAAWDLKAGNKRHEADEFIETMLMPLADALARIETGEISDAKTAIALLFAAGYIRNE